MSTIQTAQTAAPTSQLVPITRIDLIQGAGAHYPETVDGWRWAYRQRHERGIADAFRTQGRRVLVDVLRYLELIRQGNNLAQRESQAAAPVSRDRRAKKPKPGKKQSRRKAG